MANAISGGLTRFCRLLALCSAWLIALATVPSYADDVAKVDVEAAIQTFAFTSTLQHRQSILVGVVFRNGDATSEALAQRIPAMFTEKTGPALSAIAIAASELGQSTKHFDVLYLLPGMGEFSRTITDYVRRERVLSISNDPRCLTTRCCVLMVSGVDGNIVLDVGLARDANTQFATVFTMVVKRR